MSRFEENRNSFLVSSMFFRERLRDFMAKLRFYSEKQNKNFKNQNGKLERQKKISKCMLFSSFKYIIWNWKSTRALIDL